MKRLLSIVLTGIVGFVIGIGAIGMKQPATQLIHAEWASGAHTVAEQVAEADLIVRVRVLAAEPTRSVSKNMGNAQRAGHSEDAMPFTDSRMQVLQVYKGKTTARTITVMQTGGYLAKTATQPEMTIELDDDRLYQAGSEHVLFLKDISGDEIHAKNRSLYLTVNPAGRYAISGAQATSSSEANSDLPGTLAALEAEIQEALK